jgi:hypothetical protein
MDRAVPGAWRQNPMVTARDADRDLAVEGALLARFGTADQRCTSPGTVITHESVHGEFLRRFDEAVRAMPVSDPAGDVVTGRLPGERFARRFEEYRGWVGGGHRTCGSAGIGRVTANPRPGFNGDPGRGLSTSGAEAHLPSGANGRSDKGSRQSWRWVLDQFTRWQALNWDYSGRLQKAQMEVAVIEPDLSFRLPVALGTASRGGSR